MPLWSRRILVAARVLTRVATATQVPNHQTSPLILEIQCKFPSDTQIARAVGNLQVNFNFELFVSLCLQLPFASQQNLQSLLVVSALVAFICVRYVACFDEPICGFLPLPCSPMTKGRLNIYGHRITRHQQAAVLPLRKMSKKRLRWGPWVSPATIPGSLRIALSTCCLRSYLILPCIIYLGPYGEWVTTLQKPFSNPGNPEAPHHACIRSLCD